MRAVAAAVLVIALALSALIAANQPGGYSSPQTRTAMTASAPTSSSVPLATDLNQAQQTIDDPASSSEQLSSAAWFEQLVTRALVRASASVRRATLSQLDPQAAQTMQANLNAATALAGLVTPRKALPRWKIIQPPAPDTLLGYFRAAQAHYGVAWEYLAAIEFIETKFGRVDGLSTAGAQGPMQFLPATWTRYGTGDIHNPRDAIFGAAHYLVASGAPGEIAGALYHYNPSADYVHAVTDYAERMRGDVRAYYGYYYQQVIYAKAGGAVVLPVGFPKVRPVPLASVPVTQTPPPAAPARSGP